MKRAFHVPTPILESRLESKDFPFGIIPAKAGIQETWMPDGVRHDKARTAIDYSRWQHRRRERVSTRYTALNLLCPSGRTLRMLFFGFFLVVVHLAGVAAILAASEQMASRPEQIPSALTEKGKNLTALKAAMNITSTYDGGKSRQDVRGFLIYRRPSDFRFQGLAPAGGSPLFELVIRSGRFELYVPAEGTITKGQRDCFARKFPDVAEIESLIPMLLLQWKDVRFDRVLSRDSDKIVIRIAFQGRIWAATLDPKNLFLKRLVRITPYGEVDLSADFSEFKEGEDGWLPRKFDIQSTPGGWRTIVRISKIEINPFVVEKNFQLDPMFSAKTEECR